MNDRQVLHEVCNSSAQNKISDISQHQNQSSKVERVETLFF